MTELMKEGGVSLLGQHIDEDIPEGPSFLVALEGRLFWVLNDKRVIESTELYVAIGSGENCAEGAMHSLMAADPTHKEFSEEDKIKMALEVAADLTDSVSSPFWVEHEPARKTKAA